MLRGFVGYVLGALCGIFTFVTCIDPNPDNTAAGIAFAITFDVIVLTSFLTWCHKHHIKKRDEYYDKVRGKRTW